MNKDVKEVYLAFLSGEYEFRIYRGQYQRRRTEKHYFGSSKWFDRRWCYFPLIDKYLIGPKVE